MQGVFLSLEGTKHQITFITLKNVFKTAGQSVKHHIVSEELHFQFKSRLEEYCNT